MAVDLDAWRKHEIEFNEDVLMMLCGCVATTRGRVAPVDYSGADIFFLLKWMLGRRVTVGYFLHNAWDAVCRLEENQD